jgi:hypothetical protein
MTIVYFPDGLLSLTPRGKIGYGRGYGFSTYGYMKYGASFNRSGIYQRKKTLAGWRDSQMRIYAPSNPQTITQQAWRGVFAEGWTAYALLTSEEKLLLSRKARLLRMSGPNLFMREWLKANL